MIILLISFPGHGGQKPFQCRYCPYSASQKGNLKTHVLCVHRMPFDNSQYPDRRFKRSRIDSDVSGNSEDGNLPSSGQKNDPRQRFRDSWKGKKDGGELLSTPFKNMTPPVAICPAPLTHRDGGQVSHCSNPPLLFRDQPLQAPPEAASS
ncbi:hypothetical protein DPX16_13518 [Anabarilius grahami]|uniref:Zinc finger protein 536 n=1 Tax=Anabarilius grahami TaxID=495550 RepID=A0A3N0YBJ9_ANAGA|nr:hypothetical protein DPX16_13518 [Anabarilius grahami]